MMKTMILYSHLCERILMIVVLLCRKLRYALIYINVSLWFPFVPSTDEVFVFAPFMSSLHLFR